MTTHTDVAGRLLAGLNGDPDQRAATTLLIRAAHGVWLTKLNGWDPYLKDTTSGLYLDWAQLRSDLTADAAARVAFRDWAQTHAGRQASEQQYDDTHAATVPPRPWHGASTSELFLLHLAVELAPGGLLGDGVPRLDPSNRHALLAAVDDLVTGEYHQPAPPPASPTTPHLDPTPTPGSR